MKDKKMINTQSLKDIAIYLAFFGSVCYPCGGMDDFLNDFDTLEEAIEAITKKNNESEGERWANVYSLQDRMEVYAT